MRLGHWWATGYRCAWMLALSGLSGCQPGGSSLLGWYLEHAQGLEVSRSIPGTVHAAVGGTQVLSITFSTNIRQIVADLTITEGLSLPSGWSGPASFGCAKLQLDESCNLILTYAPTAAGSDTLALTYSYTDGDGNNHSGSLSIPYSSTSNNNIVVSASPSGQISAVVGAGSQSVAITFTTDDGQPATGFSIGSDLASLPSGWSAPSSFSCASVSVGNGCELILSYAPSSSGSGILTLNYSYMDNAGNSKSGALNIPYASASSNSVVGSPSPSGQIAVTLGGSQSLAVTFDTDDGNPATNLALTSDLTSLPSGWSSGAGSFSCATVSTGNGCQLSLTYAPSAVGSGSVTLQFSYTNDAGGQKSGSVIIPYLATANDNVSGTVAPSGQINAVIGAASQAVTVTFNTDDGNAASGLAVTSNLSALPSGWSSSAGSFSCASVSTGNGCQLSLTYAPTAVGSGTLSLQFSYTDNAGSAMSGTVTVPYAATTHDNVSGTVAPSGQIAVTVNGSQGVTVTFDTDDGNVATNLAITTNLASLSSGWSSSAGSFSCGAVSTGNSCQLSLTYAPTAEASGTLNLSYSYLDDAGYAKSGTVSIPYTATTNNHIIGTVAPSGTVTTVVNSSQAVTVTFTTDDGNPATALAVTSNLSSLPSGWSSNSGASFSCASVSSGNGCQLSLTFAPTATGGATLSLNYSYTNNAGSAESGTVNIPYLATTNDTVIGTAAPSGTVNVAVNASQAVSVTFTTSDGNVATSLSVTTNLSSLPSGWSSNSGTSFGCASVSTGNACQLSLTYAPSVAANSTLTLNFSYTNNAGNAESGSVNIPYTSNATIGGAVTGLSGTVVLQDNGTDNLSLSANGSFTFATALASGAAYNITVFSQPTGQTCGVTNGSGTVSTDVTNVTVTCTTNTYTIGGSISGLSQGGLVLTDNGGDALSVSSGATSFTFATPLAYGASYAVAVSTQPTGQTCTVSSGSGTVTGTVTSVTVSCTTNTYTIGGSISGLGYSGLVITDNGGNATSISSGATSFSFSTQIAYGSTYSVAVSSQPTEDTCTVSNGSGTATGTVTNVSITCTADTYSIGGAISGLSASGLVITDNGGNATSISSGATSFTFSTQIAYGNTYAVAVSTQPTGQTCSISNGSGTVLGMVNNVSITCTTNTYTIGGTISGLSQSGLVITDNGGNTTSISSGATSFTFSNQITYGSGYSVAVSTQPTGQTCTVSNGSGTATATVTNVSISCTTNTYTIGGTISGLGYSGLVITDNGGNSTSISSGATSFTFSNQIAYGNTYSVAVSTQPTEDTCTVSNGSGTVTGTVSSVQVTCTTNTYTIGGTISGLSASGLVLTDNGGNALPVSSGATSFTFSNPLAYGASYAVAVSTQPSGQLCTVSNGSGTVTGTVTSVSISCVISYTIGGTISGLTMSSVVLANASTTVTVSSGSSSWVFASSFATGSSYSVTVQTQPAGEYCYVSSGASGTLSANVSNVTVVCSVTYGYSYRQAITVNSGQVSGGPLTNFPFLFNSTDANLATVANGGYVTNANGDDIIFVALDDTTCGGAGLSPCTLYHEVENYNATTGELIAWINVPSISSSTVIYIYFGNSSVTSPTAQPTSVWDSYFTGVWHLPNGTTLTANDSTNNGNNGTLEGGTSSHIYPSATTGQIDGAAQFTAGDDNYIAVIEASGFEMGSGSFSYSFWIKTTTTTLSMALCNYDLSGGTGGYRIFVSQISGANYGLGPSISDGSNSASMAANTTVNDGKWHLAYVTVDRPNKVMHLYQDGIDVNDVSLPSALGSVLTKSSGVYTFPSQLGTSEYLTGDLDEVRMSKGIVRSSGWIQTEYNNQSAPASFYTLGSTVTM